MMNAPHLRRPPNDGRRPERKRDIVARELKVRVERVRLMDDEVLGVVGEVRRFGTFNHRPGSECDLWM